MTIHIERGTKVHVTTTNGGEADYVVADSYLGPTFALCVLSGYAAPHSPVIWIEAERLRSVTVVPDLGPACASLLHDLAVDGAALAQLADLAR